MRVVTRLYFLQTLGSIFAAVATHATLRTCNRGYCFTKKEVPLDPSAYHAVHLNDNKRRKKGGLLSSGRIDFCSATVEGRAATIDCELFHILGTEGVDEEFEAVECPKGMRCGVVEKSPSENKETVVDSTIDEGFVELDDDLSVRKSLKERPKRGSCVDNDSGYRFDCNLVEILNDGTVLIEDLRQGGVFAAHPKTDFSSKKKRVARENRTPAVILQDDPCEDFRTNIALNMEGI